MTEAATVPPTAWLSAFVPLGTYNDDSWAPLGAGVLIVDHPLVWLVTAKSLVLAAGEAPIAAFLAQGEGGTVLDLSESHRKSGLIWVEDPDLDLAATLFPLSPAWSLKAFPQKHCAPCAELEPLAPAASIACAYGMIPTERPEPFLFQGSLIGIKSPHVYTSAPLLAQNLGAPLIRRGSAGEPPSLVGILTRTLVTPRLDARVPPVVVSEAVGMEAVWDLVRGPTALLQRKHVAEQEAAAREAKSS